jgi:hypothetical protein
MKICSVRININAAHRIERILFLSGQIARVIPAKIYDIAGPPEKDVMVITVAAINPIIAIPLFLSGENHRAAKYGIIVAPYVPAKTGWRKGPWQRGVPPRVHMEEGTPPKTENIFFIVILSNIMAVANGNAMRARIRKVLCMSSKLTIVERKKKYSPNALYAKPILFINAAEFLF